MQTSTFTLNQPNTTYVLLKQVTWTAAGNRITEAIVATVGILQRVSSPIIGIAAGSTVITDSNLTVGNYGIAAVVFNGASSLLQVNNNAPTTANAGASNYDGFTLGASGGGSVPTNIQVKEDILFSGAHDANTRRQVINYLAQVGNISV